MLFLQLNSISNHFLLMKKNLFHLINLGPLLVNSKLLAVKLEFSSKSLPLRPFESDCVQAQLTRVLVCPGSNHSQILKAGDFAALWHTDPKILVLKDLNPICIVSKVKETSSVLRVSFALSNWPHFHRVYLLTVCNQKLIAVFPPPLGVCMETLLHLFYSYARLLQSRVSSTIAHTY